VTALSIQAVRTKCLMVQLHSGKTHGKTSVPLFHFEDLSKTAKEKAMPGYKMNTSTTNLKKKKMPKRGQARNLTRPGKTK
jgi:hypothetical protein